MKQCGVMVIQHACPVVSDAQQQKGGVSVLHIFIMNVNITEGFLSCFLSMFHMCLIQNLSSNTVSYMFLSVIIQIQTLILQTVDA